ncbi:hypothetical protein RHGRI_029665 [Rhododendron griersonianum]|uniref:O-fucosyltransferase family protein n=1 Tax=Rhododendron griersonianum TaxID=479676 RepID=A0AAV6INX8_9ERIC|nr:hypothetical protein RHGRI_029665 [Rhododendron griersonianum]
MVKDRAFSHSRTLTAANKFLPRKPSSSSISLYIIFLFAFSIFVFNYYSKDILEDEQKHPLPEESQSLQLPREMLWGALDDYGLRPCVEPTAKYKATQARDRYLTVRSNGGLNQMRTGISDMVAVARIMNATLVIPQLDKRSFWQDSSTFTDVFNEHHFITSLQRDVRIVKELPKELESAPRARKHFSSWSGMSYYEEMTHLWKDYQVVHVAKSDSRLANNELPLDIQRLRCRALYNALRFFPPIENLGKVRTIVSLLLVLNT